MDAPTRAAPARNVTAPETAKRLRLSRLWRLLVLAAGGLVLVVLAVAAGMLLEELRISFKENELVRRSRDEGRVLAAVLIREYRSRSWTGLEQLAASRMFAQRAERLLRDNREIAYLYLVDGRGAIVWTSERGVAHGRWRGGAPERFLGGRTQRGRVPGPKEDEPEVFLEMVTAVGSAPPVGAVVLGLTEARIAEQLQEGVWRTAVWLTGIGFASLGVFGIIYNFLSRRHAALVLDRAREEHLAHLGMLAAGLAHELRNPLNAIRFSVDSLKSRARRLAEGERPADTMQIIGEIGTELEDLYAIVSSFLSYARPPAESAEEANLGDVCRSALSVVAHQLQDKGIEANLELPAEPFVARLVVGRLRQVLVNLLLNAMQACDRGDRVVLRAAGDDQRIRIEVEDDGPGVPVELRKQLFEPFATGRSEGTGLGLAIVRRLVSEMGGSVYYRPREPKGSVFAVEIPRDHEPEAAGEVA